MEVYNYKNLFSLLNSFLNGDFSKLGDFEESFYEEPPIFYQGFRDYIKSNKIKIILYKKNLIKIFKLWLNKKISLEYLNRWGTAIFNLKNELGIEYEGYNDNGDVITDVIGRFETLLDLDDKGNYMFGKFTKEEAEGWINKLKNDGHIRTLK